MRLYSAETCPSRSTGATTISRCTRAPPVWLELLFAPLIFCRIELIARVLIRQDNNEKWIALASPRRASSERVLSPAFVRAPTECRHARSERKSRSHSRTCSHCGRGGDAVSRPNAERSCGEKGVTTSGQLPIDAEGRSILRQLRSFHPAHRVRAYRGAHLARRLVPIVGEEGWMTSHARSVREAQPAHRSRCGGGRSAVAGRSWRIRHGAEGVAGRRPLSVGAERRPVLCRLQSFVAPTHCKWVAGEISPGGWCRLYKKEPG